MGSLIRVSKKSKGAEKRLYKAVRLMILYKYKAENQCWRKKTRVRYQVAQYQMKLRVIRLAMKIAGNYKYWTCEAVGSRKAIDLVEDRNLSFLINLSNYEDMT
ncbi:hypothetical protein [Salmonella phage S115]|uniref:Uncharacterized protein n=8 Tax=Kuttervirus TaxID=2169536 RepID=A0A2Z5HMC1_9CAUD|nr:hypothetical protein CBA120_gp091 [Escherichia phage Cba120]YP_007002737.1 hypothetical protein F371_gp114 [Escherichia phage PhaxI]YP_009617682.1 hypothetical protein FDI91_gp057 [Salmonella phage STML-13-1]YP_009877702.1 hypothetical protein HYP23_gp094 [Salmonella phage SP1]YP_009880660.1 hypothetical protein HYP66_gp093 [Salmonella phage S118]YP_009887414.1 hypothetical protein HYQ29_gp077 [Salmonella phage rabagast]YP_009888196.1 hypothetical protein HYQ33_gp080 [Salmonella phage aage